MMKTLPCAICGTEGNFRTLYPDRIPQKINFAARRTPQKSHFRIVRCEKCGLIYSNPIFSEEKIFDLYRRSEFIHEMQLTNMAHDYLNQLQHIPGVGRNSALLEIGCANGFFLKIAHQAGFTNIRGIEPGVEAVNTAPIEIRELIINDFFRDDLFPEKTYDVVCLFQVFDHLIDPNRFLQSVHKVLKQDGIFLSINHDIGSLPPRLMGENSPMFDIEHIYLFDKRTMSNILEKNRFAPLFIKTLPNTYTIEYTLKMFPLPLRLKNILINTCKQLGIAEWNLSINAGNMVSASTPT